MFKISIKVIVFFSFSSCIFWIIVVYFGFCIICHLHFEHWINEPLVVTRNNTLPNEVSQFYIIFESFYHLTNFDTLLTHLLTVCPCFVIYSGRQCRYCWGQDNVCPSEHFPTIAFPVHRLDSHFKHQELWEKS